MSNVIQTITYIFLFISLNFEVFLLITYFENRGDINKINEEGTPKLKSYPTVSILVPCWNEEKTVSGTIYSLLNLNYPKEKLKILVIDDGSTDNTWNIIQKFANHPQVKIFTKPNGGKYTALNFGISKSNSELIGCLDADSYVDKDALTHIVKCFENKENMAVAPSVKLWKPKGVLQMLQRVEYGFGIFTRKMFHYMNAIYITPGPFSIFRKEVFEIIGGYEHAHTTEDIQIALRMQKGGLQIAHAHNAIVYTVPPDTLPKLLKQRTRWSYGFIKNAVDFKDMFFNPKYGNLGIIVLPMAGFSVFSILTLSIISVVNLLKDAMHEFIKIQTIGLHFSLSNFNLDWFFINTEVMAIIGIVSILATITMILTSKQMSEGKLSFGMDLIYFLTLYIVIAPMWIAKAAFNSLFRVKTSWR
jgi:cellulose synthase/poly-beta-1,6-N-acetylglucosamine synthase-like glycosyltransferase